MRKTTTLKTANEMRFNKSDFILQHKNTAFTEIYQTDKILGQGKYKKDLTQCRVLDAHHLNYAYIKLNNHTSCRWIWQGNEVHTQSDK